MAGALRADANRAGHRLLQAKNTVPAAAAAGSAEGAQYTLAMAIVANAAGTQLLNHSCLYMLFQ